VSVPACTITAWPTSRPDDPDRARPAHAAGLSAERIAEHMTAGRVRVDGELVTDLDAPTPSADLLPVGQEDRPRLVAQLEGLYRSASCTVWAR